MGNEDLGTGWSMSLLVVGEDATNIEYYFNKLISLNQNIYSAKVTEFRLYIF